MRVYIFDYLLWGSKVLFSNNYCFNNIHRVHEKRKIISNKGSPETSFETGFHNYEPGWVLTHIYTPASDFKVLWLKVYATIPSDTRDFFFFLNFIFYSFLFYVHCCVSIYVCVGILDPLEVELLVVITCCISARNQNQVLWKNSQCP